MLTLRIKLDPERNEPLLLTDAATGRRIGFLRVVRAASGSGATAHVTFDGFDGIKIVRLPAGTRAPGNPGNPGTPGREEAARR